MLIHPWDAGDDAEWRQWLKGHDFGQLVAGGRGRDLLVVVPTHFLFDGEATVWLHLARPNPVWPLLEEHPRALLTVIGEYTYIPSDWNTADDPALGVPTSYYATAQLACDVRVVDDPEEKAALLNRQLGHFEPGSGRVPVSAVDAPDRRLLPGIRGIELTVTSVQAKFKYGGNKTPADRERISGKLAARGGPLDAAALDHLQRRG
ncbi:FMN-binding negative transcriptional regulator [Amycolatopsis rhabdoformis]|uniref:FMN-binding negative transcriptional regulator n=1 Tax=Amycolatopsis rhabdoformis TaxID=1448059 RepID=A0ABZ1I6I3_9PSEU|nr:FMN-binding negative transcriptional regulator [Amycolatopsis rhabdoformis]WSE29571.1 FMN-binding negative transcriptional regulator [Amycolatopsis rhabdoformis]